MLKSFLISTQHEFSKLNRLLYLAPEGMVYHSKEYLDVIAKHTNSELFYLGVLEKDKLVGALPLALKRNKKLGNIINSCPFYGSYGGIIVDPGLSLSKKTAVKRRLLAFLNSFATDNDCILSTIITSPFDKNQLFYFNNLKHNYFDERITQNVLFPRSKTPKLRDSLFFDRFSSSCRRAIRKAENQNIKINKTAESGTVLNKFYELYKENMIAMNAPYKDKRFFELALKDTPNGFCDLRYAEVDGHFISGIFNFYYKDIVEYYQPAIRADYRSSGATNLLVFNGMTDCMEKGYSCWNFGGTPKTNETLRMFKRSFGAQDYYYYYFTIAHTDDTHIRALGPTELANAYPDFYVLPYSKLQGGP